MRNSLFIPMLLSLSLCACAQNPPQPDPRLAPPAMNSVTFVDYSLNRSKQYDHGDRDNFIRISAPRHGIKRTQSGTSQAWAQLRNHTDYPYYLEVRAMFFDQSGMPLNSPGAWQRIPVPANGLATFRENSISTERLQYIIEVRQVQG